MLRTGKCRILRLAIVAATLVGAWPAAAQEDPSAAGSVETQPAAPGEAKAAPGAAAAPPAAPQDKEARLKQLVSLLKSFSDEDYHEALGEAGGDLANHPELVSRSAVIKSGYETLAALEYHKAVQQAPKDAAGRYSEAYQRALKQDVGAVSVDPGTLQETGRGWELFKIAAKAALKYGITAALMAAGRETDASADAQRDRAISKYEDQLASADIPPDRQAEVHYNLGSTYEAQADAVEPENRAALAPEKRARLKALAGLLESISDQDYHGALRQVLGQIPAKGERPALASRGAALNAAYTTLAAMEYRLAADQAPKKAEYSDAYRRAVDAAPDAVAVNPETMQETGWGVDLLKFLANAAINYELNGGETVVGRGLGSPEGRELDQRISSADKELADAGADADKKADAHFKLGAAYERKAAAAAGPETEEARLAKKESRLQQTADVLQSVSDDDYQEALKQLPETARGRAETASRGGMLRSAYATLAALEYRQAARRAPAESAAGYTGDYQRLAASEAGRLAVNPETLEETGWLQDLFNIGAVGGIGYLVYENQRLRRHRGGSAPTPPSPQPGPVECPKGTRLDGGKCVGDVTCPPGTHLAGADCVGDVVCPKGSERQGDACVAMLTCPERTHRDGDRCVGDVACGAGTRLLEGRCVGDVVCGPGARLENGRCVGDTTCPGGTHLADGRCAGDPACPPGTNWDGSRCLGGRACPAGTKLEGGACVGDVVCAPGTEKRDGKCEGDTVCPPGTKLGGGRCVGAFGCPEGSKQDGDRCVGDKICPPGSRRDGEACLGDVVCPPGTKREGNACAGELVCPKGTHRQGDSCVQEVVCPPRTHRQGDACLADLICPPEMEQRGNQCVAKVICPPPMQRQGDRCIGFPLDCPRGTRPENGRCVGLLPGPVTVLESSPARLMFFPGQTFELCYNWQGGPTEKPLKAFVHFVDESKKAPVEPIGRIVVVNGRPFQDDHFPPTPTNQWSGRVGYCRAVTVPPGLRPGEYQVYTGLYDASQGAGGPRYPLTPGPGVRRDEQTRYQIATLLARGPEICPAGARLVLGGCRPLPPICSKGSYPVGEGRNKVLEADEAGRATACGRPVHSCPRNQADCVQSWERAGWGRVDSSVPHPEAQAYFVPPAPWYWCRTSPRGWLCRSDQGTAVEPSMVASRSACAATVLKPAPPSDNQNSLLIKDRECQSAGFLIVPPLRQAVEEYGRQLAGAEIGAADAAELHHKLGAVYEELASAAIQAPTAPPSGEAKPAALPPAKAQAAETPGPKAPAMAEKPPKPATKPPPEKPKPAAAPEKPALSREDRLKRGMQDMDDMEKSMEQEVEKRRDQLKPQPKADKP